MTNLYLEHSKKEKDSFDYFISTDIDDNGIVSIETYIKDKHIHFSELVENFNITLNAIKSYTTNHSTNNATYDEAYEISVNHEENTITVTIFDPDFDVDSLIKSYTYSVGYLQCHLINSYATNNGGEINA